MIVVTQLRNGKLAIKSDYFYRTRLKDIPTAVFDQNIREWVIEDFMLGVLESKFKGEIVYKTPRWVILKQPMPDMSAIYKISDSSIKAPTLKMKLYDYQDYGIRFMIDKINKYNFVLNADDVGLGKTIQTIGTIKWFIQNRNVKKILIICKKSIKKQWKDEIIKFTDLNNIMPIEYTGSTPAQRKKCYDIIGNTPNGVLITNYHTFLNDTDLINDLDFDFCVIDEVHSVKARTGKLNNNIAQVVRGKPTVFLTGTPIMSMPEDIFGIIQMVNPSYFGQWRSFCKKFLVIDTGGKFGTRVVGAKHLDELRDLVQDILIRRTEYEVSVQLPKVIYQKKEVEMDKTQENIIKAINEYQDELANKMAIIQKTIAKPGGDTPENHHALEQIEGQIKGYIAARQAASTDPRMFLRSTSHMMKTQFGQLIPKNYTMSQKSEAILDTVDDIVMSGDKVILFTKYRTCATMIADDIKNILKIPVLLYTGTENETAREDALSKFCNTVSYNVLIGTEALAEGVNLQVAKYVINIDQPDTFAIKVQRIGRARRVGSNFSNVIVYDMITLDSSTNEKIRSKDIERLNNIEKNQDLISALVSLDEAQSKALVAAMKG